MTPKEKAKELVYKYSCLHLGEDFDKWKENGIVFDSQDKQCALISVDEILKITWVDKFLIVEDYWLEVKQEIEKL
tara:strand:+ start:3003 stop:3227 length:225 start_codon:yes stop_codon:yes gene_type:complete